MSIPLDVSCITQITIDQLDRELGRFFQAADAFEKDTAQSAMMPKCIVDSRWHELLGSSEYDVLVSDALGKGVKIEHIEAGGFDLIKWVPYYEQLFGPLDASWFSRPDGTVDTIAEMIYRNTGELRCSWDCTPGIVR